MADPARKLDRYPLDLSDLSPRLLELLARQGITAEQIREVRRHLTPEQAQQMEAFERGLQAMGVTLEEFWDDTPTGVELEDEIAFLEGRSPDPWRG